MGVRVRRRALWGALLALGALWLYTTADTFAHTQELCELAQSRFHDVRIMPKGFRSAELAISAVVTHEFIFFGQPRGMASFFTKATTEDDKVVYWSVDYNCVMQDGTWKVLDSTMEMHRHGPHEAALKALAKNTYASIER